jgi:hypothetical protein
LPVLFEARWNNKVGGMHAKRASACFGLRLRTRINPIANARVCLICNSPGGM